MGATPFYLACLKGHLEVVRMLLNLENPKIDYLKATIDSYNPFCIACFNGHLSVVEKLLSLKDLAIDYLKVNKN